MNRTIVVTGAASGIGQATANYLRSNSNKVIGVDVSGADINADLATADGRSIMIDTVRMLAPGGIDGVVAAAGLGFQHEAAKIISVNYFGAVATLEGLRPLMAEERAPRAVAVISTAALLRTNDELVETCLKGDEEAARKLASAEPQAAYLASKKALSLWLRRTAVTPHWAGSNVILNGVSPGTVLTPMTMPLLEDEQSLKMIKKFNPIAVRDYAQPEALAEILGFMVTMKSGYMVGQLVYVDGGSDALIRPEII